MPTLPVLGNDVSLFKPANSNSILDSKHVRYVASGGSAIYLALKSHGIKQGDEVLVPSYHCPAMVEPVVSLGGKPVFYSITPDIQIDMQSVVNSISDKTIAILVPHFFGKRSDIKTIREKCRLSQSIGIIEDCAHAFFSSSNELSEQGDYIIGSLTKFFSTHDGGVLASNTRPLIQTKSLSVKQELKAAYNAIHEAVRFGRFKLIAWLFSLIAYLRSRDTDNESNDALDEDEASEEYTSDYHDEMSLSASKACQYIVKHADFARIIDKRKKNYRYILQQLSSEASVDLSLNTLGDDFVPYMVIVKLLDAEKHHARLIAKRLPIWRWENIYPSDCEVAKEYAQTIVQLPCHHQLTEKELVSMVASIKQCLSAE